MALELFKLLGIIKVDNDEANAALDNTSKKGQKAQGKLSKAFGAVGKGAAVAGKAIAVGMAAGATAVGALVTKSVQAYAEYEQLVGGVETLFGTGGQSLEDYTASVGQSVDSIKKFQKEAGIAVDGIMGPQTMSAIQKRYDSLTAAQGKVMQNANKAFRTAGMSANAYMETVTGFSASLISSLGGDTEKAAALADQAIIDMADNANKMGTDIESIQNAYQGFAKQNYTMLDNLKLGYGGTKEEMQRLLKDAEKLTGKKFDVSNFADITEAIHAIQTEMGITGTTANEASTTISGSISSMKASWENMLVAISADDMPFDQYVNDFTTSVATVADNLIPRIGTALEGVVQLVDKLAPVIIEKLPGLFEQLLPPLIEAASGLVNSLVNAAPGILGALMECLPALIEGITNLITALVFAFPDIFELILDALPGLIESICAALPELLPILIDGLITGIMLLMAYLPDIIQPIIDKLPEIITSITTELINNLPRLILGVTELIVALATQLPQLCKAILDALDDVLTGLVESLVTWGAPIIAKAAEWWDGVKSNLSEKWTEIKSSISEKVSEIASGLSEKWSNIKTTASEKWDSIKSTASAKWESVKSTVSDKVESLKTSLSTKWNSIFTTASTTWSGIKSKASSVWSGIKDSIGDAIDGAKDLVDTAIQKIKNLFDFEFKWPKLPMPHFSVSGTMNPLKWIEEGVPKIGVEWYAKAMKTPMLMNSPTIFGYDPASGNLRGGGEAGSEITGGTSAIMGMIRAAVAGQMNALAYYLERLLDVLETYFPQVLEVAGHDIVTNDGVVIGHYAPMMDAALGRIQKEKERGR